MVSSSPEQIAGTGFQLLEMGWGTNPATGLKNPELDSTCGQTP
jgi:hypothetical protein